MNITCLGPRHRRHHLAICALFAVLALTLTACGSSTSGSGATSAAGAKGLYGSLPPAGTPKKGGTITIGQLTGSTPTYIFPIVPTASASVYTALGFMNYMFLPLYTGPYGSKQEIYYPLSLGDKPVFSDGDKTVTIHMKTNLKWSDGQPVDANDLVFDIDLVKQAVAESPANWSAFTPGLLPDSLASISSPSKYTVVMHLKRAFNPGFFLNNQLQGNLYPLPSTAWNLASAGGPHLDYTVPANAKKIYDYLSKAGGQVASFATNPLWKTVDGPFRLKSFSATNSSFTVSANPAYGGSPKPSISQLQVQTYTGVTPQLNALRTGDVDIAGLDFSQLGQVGSLRAAGYSVFGYPDLGWFGAFFNFKDKTGHFDSIISQLYVRQALAHLQNQPAYLSGIFKNAGVVAYGPVPSAPPTAYTPSDAVTAPYPYNPSTAVALLRAHGWHVVPNGTTTCAKAGSGPGECGAGIPVGTPFKFTWFYIPPSSTPSSSLESEAFASEAKQAAGINIELHSKSFNFLAANYNDADPSMAKYTNDWGVNNFGGLTDSFYPTSSTVFNTGGTFNAGAYNSSTANRLINQSVYGSDLGAVANEASFLTKDIPVLFFPNSDLVFAVSRKVGGPAGSFLPLTQYVPLPQFWYLTK